MRIEIEFENNEIDDKLVEEDVEGCGKTDGSVDFCRIFFGELDILSFDR